MFARLVRRGLWQRKSRALVAVLALTLAATLTAALLNLYVDAQRKIQSEFRLYGANLMVTPRVTAGENSAAELLPGALARQLKRDFVPDRLTAVVPYLYAVVELKGESVVLAGTWLDQFSGLGGFRLTAGDAPGSEAGGDKCWVGAAVAARFELSPGKTIALRYREATYTCQVAGVVETGQAEDNQVLADLAAVQALAGAAGRLNVILARADGDAAAIHQSPHLTDLQRVFRPRLRGERWLIKDLASLNYSAPAGLIARADRLRWLKRYLGVAKLDELFSTVIDADSIDGWYLCGPSGMVEAARRALAARGVDEADIHDELFYAGDEVRVEIPADDPEGSTVRFTLNGRTSTLVIDPDGLPILDHALSARPDAPFSCRSGACASCRALVTDGEVRMDRNWALSDDEVAAGQVLTCQSHPVSETVELTYDL